MSTDGRDHVSHYADTKFETIDVIFDKLGVEGGIAFCLGNMIKYSTRALYKGQFRSDIVKARNYANFILEKLDELPDEDPKRDTYGQYL